jgi:rhodanese-related sulfurtransferase
MSRRTKLIITAVAFLSFVMLVANWGTTNMNMYRNTRINATEARAKMIAHPSAIVLDVRSQREFATGRIPGAILLPHDAIYQKAATVIPNKNALILVYCRSGARSADATYALISMGYTNVFDFGGILDWPYDVTQ